MFMIKARTEPQNHRGDLLLNKIKNHQNVFFYVVVFTICFLLFNPVAKAEYVNVCLEEGAEYEGTYGQWYTDGFGCDLPPGCYLHVNFAFRDVPIAGQMSLEIVIYSIYFVGPCAGLSQECEDAKYKLAMMAIAQYPDLQIRMGLYDYIGTWCYNRAYYKMSSCWTAVQYYNPIRFGWEACGAECCTGKYEICKHVGVTGTDGWSVEKISGLQTVTDNCQGTCVFNSCESTMPPEKWEQIGTFQDIKGISGWTPKSSIQEIQQPDLKIYISPNPTDDFINIQFSGDKSSIYVLKVLNNNGKTVYSQDNISFNKSEIQSVNFNASQMSSGIYLVQLIGNQGDFRYDKFIISK